jgi:rubrerythrin
MDMEYLKEHICEELEGAKEYAVKAMELKPMAPTWSKMLIDMANAELTHAGYLYKMLVEYYQKIAASFNEVPEHIETLYRDSVRCYSTESANAKYMLDAYTK